MVMLPPSIAVVPAASVVRLLSLSAAVPAPPTRPPSVVNPLSLMVRLRLPPLERTVLARVTPTPVSTVLSPSVTASL